MKSIEQQKTVLHVGCGAYNPDKLCKVFKNGDWKEIRYDIDERVNPDIVGDIRKMDAVEDNSVDAVYSSHNLEHLYDHEVTVALKEFYRVLKVGGLAVVTVPNLQVLAKYIESGDIDEKIYDSPAGPVSPIDIIFGFRASIEKGNEFMAHRTAFTPKRLQSIFEKIGFNHIKLSITDSDFNLWVTGYKPPAK